MSEPFPLTERGAHLESFPVTSKAVPAEKGRRGSAFLRQDLVGAGIMAAGSICSGWLFNGFRSHPLPWTYESPKDRLGAIVARMAVPSPQENLSEPAPGQWQPMDLDEFQRFVLDHKGTTIDARSAAFYAAGHVPGAMNLPREDFDEGFAAIRARLESAREWPIVVYCSEADCQDSELVAAALSRLQYRHLFVYKEGWEEWTRAGLPQQTGHSL